MGITDSSKLELKSAIQTLRGWGNQDIDGEYHRCFDLVMKAADNHANGTVAMFELDAAVDAKNSLSSIWTAQLKFAPGKQFTKAVTAMQTLYGLTKADVTGIFNDMRITIVDDELKMKLEKISG